MNALQIRVSKLRRSLGASGAPDVVSREGVGYRANVEPDAVDAIDFADRVRAARAAAADLSGREVSREFLEGQLSAYDGALGLWRGEPLSDFTGEQWASTEAARLNALRITALTERAQTALALGRHDEVVHDLEPVVGDDPTLESLAGLLMVALYRSARQADALEVYSRTRDTLDEELGLEPSVTLRSLQERVLRQDESLGAQPEMAVPVRTPHRPAHSERIRRRCRAGQRAMGGPRSSRRRTCLPSSGRSSVVTSCSSHCAHSSRASGCSLSSGRAVPARRHWLCTP